MYIEYARDILEYRIKKELIFMLGLIAISAIVFLLTSRSAHDATYKKESKPRRYMIVLVLIAYVCVSVSDFILPALNDYRNNGIVCSEGIYVNRPNVSSNLFGSPVEFTVDGETINLETYCVDVVAFPDGVYSATAYYTENSKILLCLYDLKEIN